MNTTILLHLGIILTHPIVSYMMLKFQKLKFSVPIIFRVKQEKG